MALLIFTLVAVFVVLPKVVNTPSGGESTLDSTAKPDAQTSPSPVPEVEQKEITTAADGLARTVNDALLEGREALAARDPEAAATAFRRAASLDPGNAAAKDGLQQTETLTEVRDLEIMAVSHERRGEKRAAEAAARRALELDPSSQVARTVTGRLALEAGRDAYQDLVTLGLAALGARQYQSALDAFSAASKLRPEAPEVIDGLARAQAGILRQRVAAHLSDASTAEESERWAVAVGEYRSVLALEPANAMARDGLARSSSRLDLIRKMEAHLSNPDRLATPEVLEEAAQLATEARAVSHREPQFDALIARLDRLVTESSTPVSVVLESDGLTEVMLFRVGRLGTFDRHTVELRPGTYTVVGRRAGFRDVRISIKVGPGQSPPAVTIRCTERI